MAAALFKGGNILSPQLAWLLSARHLSLKLSSSRTFVERILHGLRFRGVLTLGDIDELIARHPLHERAAQKDLDQHEVKRAERLEELLEERSTTFEWSFLHSDSMVPWDQLVLKPMTEMVLVQTLCTVMVFVVTPTWECVRGYDPTIHVTLTTAALLFVVVYALVHRVHAESFKQLEGRVAIGFGVVAAATAFVTLAQLYIVSPVAFRVAGVADLKNIDSGAVVPMLPNGVLDLGSSLRAGFNDAAGRVGETVGADVSTFMQGQAFFVSLAISAALGCVVTLLFFPVYRLGQCYSDLLLLSDTGVRATSSMTGQLYRYARRQVLVFWQYAPAVLAMLWYRQLSQMVVSPALVRCTEAATARDCTPDGTFVGGFLAVRTWLESKPHLGDVYTIAGETDWLRIRLVCVLLYALSWAFLARPFVGHYLDTSNGPISRVLRLAAEREKKGFNHPKVKEQKGQGVGVARLSKCGESALVELQRTCAIEALRPVVGSARTLLDVITPAVILGCLAVLALRLSGIDMGVCEVYNLALPSVAAKLKDKTQFKPELYTQLAANVLFYFNGSDDVGDAVASARRALYVLAPAFWRPVLSFIVFFLLFWLFLLLELSFMYWRYVRPGALEAMLDKSIAEKEAQSGKQAEKPKTQ